MRKTGKFKSKWSRRMRFIISLTDQSKTEVIPGSCIAFNLTSLRIIIKLATPFLILAPILFTVVRRSAMSNAASHSSGIFSVAYVSAPSFEIAKKLAHGIVSNKLGACVNMIPHVTSVYSWQGDIQEDSEILLMIKTRTSIIEKLIEFVRKNHPYEACEVISIPIEKGHEAYLKWMGDYVPEKN